MTTGLPPNLLPLFAPRPPLTYLPPVDREIKTRKGPTLEGISQYVTEFTDPVNDPPPTAIFQSREEKKKRLFEERKVFFFFIWLIWFYLKNKFKKKKTKK